MTTSRARTSASRTRAPRWANMRLTVLLPVAMLPVRPTRRKRLTVAPRSNASRLRPVRARLDVDLERDIERHGGFHHLPRQGFEARHLALRGFEEQLVVHLQEHPGLEATLVERLGHAHHGDLD